MNRQQRRAQEKSAGKQGKNVSGAGFQSLNEKTQTLYHEAIKRHQAGNLAGAVRDYQRIISTHPGFIDAHINLGLALFNLGKAAEALPCYQKALEINPRQTTALFNFGHALEVTGNIGEAMQYYRKTLEIEPEHPEAHHNIGGLLKNEGKFEEARAHYEAALKANPNLAEAYYNLGIIYGEQRKYRDAIDCYRRAWKLKPGFTIAGALLLYALQKACMWEEFAALEPEVDALLDQAIEKNINAGQAPFAFACRSMDAEKNYHIARLWSEDIMRRAQPLKALCNFDFKGREKKQGKIVLGYFSNRFWDCATMHLTRQLYALHDREHFEVRAYSYGKDDGSEYRKAVEQECDAFVDIAGMNDAEAAQKIYDDGVDILIDLGGHTQHTRPAIAALRPAPVQATWLVYAGTTGAEYFDYIITDKTITPSEHFDFYEENPVRMPHCYQINNDHQVIANTPFTRKSEGLPEDAFVFASFCQPHKIEPVMWKVWMNLLRQVEGSVLWLWENNDMVRDTLRQEAVRSGVMRERILFARSLPREEHLARLKLADLMLDTRIYGGHTTTSDALWAGVPVVTMMGTHFASRVCASILKAADLPQLVTQTPEDYEMLALKLAQDEEALRQLKETLKKNRASAPHFDTEGFVRSLEKGYQEMWERCQAEKLPQPLEIK